MQYVDITKIKVVDESNRANSEKDIIESVGKEGILSPLSVYEDGDSFVLIAGHRRLESAKHFQLTEVPVEIFPADRAETIRALENLDRRALHPLDEAEEIKKLQSVGYTNGMISSILSMPVDRVKRRARLNSLSEKIMKKFREGVLSVEKAEELAVAPAEIQDKFEDIPAWWDIKRLRMEILDAQGISLNSCPDDFLILAPKCTGCKHNPVTEDSLLFPGLCGSCKDSKCYAEKLKKLAKKYNAKGIYLSAPNKVLKKLLEGSVVEDLELWRLSASTIEGAEVYINSDGNVRWYRPSAATTTKENTKAEELADKFDELRITFNKKKAAFFKEVATAYMDKNYRNIPLNDQLDVVMLAKGVIAEAGYQFRNYVEIDDKGIRALDNRMRVGYALVWCKSTANNLDKPLKPYRLYTSIDDDKITLPRWMEIDSILNLRKIKAKATLEKLAQEMQQTLDQYREEVGKNG